MAIIKVNDNVFQEVEDLAPYKPLSKVTFRNELVEFTDRAGITKEYSQADIAALVFADQGQAT